MFQTAVPHNQSCGSTKHNVKHARYRRYLLPPLLDCYCTTLPPHCDDALLVCCITVEKIPGGAKDLGPFLPARFVANIHLFATSREPPDIIIKLHVA
jgi:hypothetical protein